MPRYKTYAAEWDEARSRRPAASLEVTERTSYGPDSPHSWVLDRAAIANRGIDPLAQERLNREAAVAEKRAVGSSTLGGLIPAVIEPGWPRQSPTASGALRHWQRRCCVSTCRRSA
jgi:hypothetical protein